MPQDDLFVEQIRCGPMQNFVYLVGSKATREVAIVDPAWAIDELIAHVEKQDLTPKKVELIYQLVLMVLQDTHQLTEILYRQMMLLSFKVSKPQTTKLS